ncbi:TPA: hypothetical protein N0F65_008872, partial [Lagenidium giganteum]
SRLLCSSRGHEWPYGDCQNPDRRARSPLFVLRGGKNRPRESLPHRGAGTGKSRMLHEMKGLLCEAATPSQLMPPWCSTEQQQEVFDRMDNAYVFKQRHSSFRRCLNTTSASACCTSSCQKNGCQLKRSCSPLRWTIENVISMLAEMEDVGDMKTMSVIICVAGWTGQVNERWQQHVRPPSLAGFDSKFDESTRRVDFEVLPCRGFDVYDHIGETRMNVEQLQSLQLIRITPDARLECAFIPLVLLLQNLSRKNADGDVPDNLLSTMEHVFEDTSMKELKVVSAELRDTKSCSQVWKAPMHLGSMLSMSTTHASPVGEWSKRSRMQRSIALQAPSNATEELSDEARTKAVADSEVFMLITNAKADTILLPPRCRIVSEKEFGTYCGPFATRAYGNFLDPPDVTSASRQA